LVSLVSEVMNKQNDPDLMPEREELSLSDEVIYVSLCGGSSFHFGGLM